MHALGIYALTAPLSVNNAGYSEYALNFAHAAEKKSEKTTKERILSQCVHCLFVLVFRVTPHSSHLRASAAQPVIAPFC